MFFLINLWRGAEQMNQNSPQPAVWVDFVGGARIKLHNQIAIEVQQGKMPNDPWYWYGFCGIPRAHRVGGYPTKEEAQLAAVKHARSELLAALNSLPNTKVCHQGREKKL
jgi:hypothetical protein